MTIILTLCLNFNSLAPVVCVGAAVMVSLLFLDSIRQHCSELYFFPPHLLSVQVLGLFSQALVAFPHLLVLFKFDSQIEEWDRRTSSGTTTSGSNTSVFISLHSVTVRKGKGKIGLNSSQGHCHQSWNWMAPPDLQTCILRASQSSSILKIKRTKSGIEKKQNQESEQLDNILAAY